jgi:hypothetical protein
MGQDRVDKEQIAPDTYLTTWMDTSHYDDQVMITLESE